MRWPVRPTAANSCTAGQRQSAESQRDATGRRRTAAGKTHVRAISRRGSAAGGRSRRGARNAIGDLRLRPHPVDSFCGRAQRRSRRNEFLASLSAGHLGNLPSIGRNINQIARAAVNEGGKAPGSVREEFRSVLQNLRGAARQHQGASQGERGSGWAAGASPMQTFRIRAGAAFRPGRPMAAVGLARRAADFSPATSIQEQIRRTVQRAPEAVVKVLLEGRQRSSKAVGRHMDYIGRYGKLDLEEPMTASAIEWPIGKSTAG